MWGLAGADRMALCLSGPIRLFRDCLGPAEVPIVEGADVGPSEGWQDTLSDPIPALLSVYLGEE